MEDGNATKLSWLSPVLMMIGAVLIGAAMVYSASESARSNNLPATKDLRSLDGDAHQHTTSVPSSRSSSDCGV